MSDIETKLGHSNIDDVGLKRIRKYCGKTTKDITKEEKEKCKAFFEGKEGVFIIEKLTRDIIEHCKLPKAIEWRKKLGYNHNNIIVWEETSIAEKIIKRFPHENIALNNRFNNKKPDGIHLTFVKDRRIYNCSDLKLDLYCYIYETL